VRAVPLFVGSYLAVWALVGIAVYALYQPHGTFAAGALTVAAGVYELTPLKRDCRRRCRQSVRSGFEFGSRSRANDVNPMPLADPRCSDMKGERADDEPQDRNA
jgi:predicted metal-binding membrane protein